MLDKTEVLHLWEQWCAVSATNVILFVGDYPTTLSASSVCQFVCESTLSIQLHSHMLDKNGVLHLWERWRAASPTNVILFVGDNPTTKSASSVCQVVCESTLIIQLHSRMLDKNEVLHLWERWGAVSPTNVIELHLWEVLHFVVQKRQISEEQTHKEYKCNYVVDHPAREHNRDANVL